MNEILWVCFQPSIWLVQRVKRVTHSLVAREDVAYDVFRCAQEDGLAARQEDWREGERAAVKVSLKLPDMNQQMEFLMELFKEPPNAVGVRLT